MRVCIVGGGGGASNAANVVRLLDKEAQIDIFTNRGEIGNIPCEIPFVLRGTIPSWEDSFAFREGFYRERNITVHLNTEVTDIFRQEKRLVAGGKSYQYDKAILDLGATPWVPPIPGLDGWNEFVLGTDLKYARAFEQAIPKYTSAAIVGAGAIGLEVAAALLAKGYHPIYVLDVLENVLGVCLDKDMAERVEERIKDKGIELILAVNIQGITSKGGKKVLTLPQREMEADFVFFACGAKPNTELARRAGLAIGETGAIAVNEYLQTSDPDIYAIGDCMENWDMITGSKRRHQLATNAARTGSIAARNLVLGNVLPYRGTVMAFIIEVFGYQVGAVGFTEKQAREHGLDVVSSTTTATRRRLFGGKPIHIKLIARRDSHALVGAQVVSEELVAGQIDKLAVAVAERIPAERLALIDTCYSPPLGSAYAPLAMALDELVPKLVSDRGKL
ncbi:MAG TPA: FAD-dependent oxidoreductase [Dehalococcoidia bacterium]|nr:FAD-dependent oxidoreductase [Dehalococcoidia bacterium]